MTFREVCEGWADEVMHHVPELTDARLHLFSSWSPELFHAAVGETHLAVFPLGDPETTRGLTTEPADEVTTLYELDVWQGATAEDGRLVENRDLDLAWIELYELVRSRFYVTANVAIGGDPNAYTRYQGGQLGTANSCRYLRVSFAVRWSLSYV